jgi:iron complex outermembrane receptor protein
MLALATASGVMAADDAQDAAALTVLEEITITATKRSKSQQDVGITVSAVTGDQVRELGVNDIEDLIGLLPGTGFNDVAGGGIPVVIIRGVGLQNFRVNDTPTTAIYVDEVYQTSVAEAVATIFDVERVEVLKGPQGGLYGRNAVGGAIQVISAKPNFDETEGYLSLDYSRYDRVEAEAVLSGPLSDKIAYRIGGKMITSGDTYYHSATGDFDHGEEERWSARGQLELRPSDKVNVLFKFHGGEDTSELPLPHAVGLFRRLGLGLGAVTGVGDTADGAILNARPQTTSLTNICDAVLAGGRDPSSCETLSGLTPDELGINSRYDSASNAKPQLDNSWWGASATANFYLGDFTLTSITAYSDFDHGRFVDMDTTDKVHQEIDYRTQIEAWSQELRLGYDGGGDFSWIVGLNYAEDEQAEDTDLNTETGILRTQLGGLTLAEQHFVQKTDAFAVYGRADWRFSEKFNLVLEARYTDEKKAFEGGVTLPQVGRALSYIDDEESYGAASGKVALEYFATDNALFYISASKGFKSGGFFGGFATSNAQLEPFRNEKIYAYEAGFKTDWPEQRLRLNGSVFYYDRQDVQANARDPRGIVAVARLTNIGDVETYGAEIESIWSPTRNLTFQAGLAYLKTEITSSDLLTSNIFRTSTEETYEGARLANQPEFSANVVGRYERELSSSLLGALQLEYSYRSEQDQSVVVMPQESAFLTEPGYSLVNVRASLGAIEGGWQVTAYVTNLFDKAYRESAGGAGPSGVFEIYGAPRIWGLSLDYSF